MATRRTTSIRQLELLCAFCRDHRDLALGRVRSKEGRALAKKLWAECAELLNPEGPPRSPKEWAKVWNDLKCRVRQKLLSNQSGVSGTGGGPDNQLPLTPLEEQVASIIGRDVGPLPGVRVPVPDLEVIQEGVVEEESAPIPCSSSQPEIEIFFEDSYSNELLYNEIDNVENISPNTSRHDSSQSLSHVGTAALSTSSQRPAQVHTTPRRRRIERARRQRAQSNSEGNLSSARAALNRIELLRADTSNKYAQIARLRAETDARNSESLREVVDVVKAVGSALVTYLNHNTRRRRRSASSSSS